MLTLRPATIDDAPLLRRWDDEPHVLASDPNDDWQWETELRKTPPWREQLIAELDGVPIGFLQIIDPAEEGATTGATCPPTCVPSTSGSARRPISAAATAP